jgi:hypothetical protein
MPYPYVSAGDRVVCTLAAGPTLVGELRDAKLDRNGRLLALYLLVDGDADPVAVHGDAVALWRRGEPVQVPRAQQQAPPGIVVPQLHIAGNGGRPQG